MIKMKNKNNSRIGRILIILLISLFLMPIVSACDTSNFDVEISRTIACEENQVLVLATGLKNCDSIGFTLRDASGRSLRDPVPIKNDFALTDFRIDKGIVPNRANQRCGQFCASTGTHADKSDELHYIEPITYQGSKEEAIKKMHNIIKSMRRTELLESKEKYFRYQFTTLLLRFQDDVEFLYDDDAKLIHFRSQSRVGGFDWGTNRRRMEKIRRKYMK